MPLLPVRGRGRIAANGLRLFLTAGQALRQRGEFGLAAVGLPNNAPVVVQAKDRAMRRAAQGLNAVARLEGGALAEAFDDTNHAFTVEHAGDIVGNGRHHLTAAAGGEIGEKSGCKLPSDICKGIAIEEEEGGTPMAVSEEI